MGYQDASEIPEEWLPVVVHHFQVYPNETDDFRQPILRKSLRKIYPFFILLYALIVVAGVVANVMMAQHIKRSRLYTNAVCVFLLNVNACNVIMSVIVLPLSLAILLIQNWIFGKFLCFFIPMLQVYSHPKNSDDSI